MKRTAAALGEESMTDDAELQNAEPIMPTITSTLTEGEPLSQVESLCSRCQANGRTSFMLVKIPHFKETLLASFECGSCGWKNKEVSSMATLQDFGIRIEVSVERPEDLNRQLVKSEHCTLLVPELELELPPAAQSLLESDDQTTVRASKAVLTTIEGLLQGVVADLELDQPVRLHVNPTMHAQMETFMARIQSLLTNNDRFTLVLDDPSGNSYVELLLDNVADVESDPRVHVARYTRSQEQTAALGFSTQATMPAVSDEGQGEGEGKGEGEGEGESGPAEESNIYEFPGSCPSCKLPCFTRMHPLEIPYFKEVIIMSTVCEHCGYKSNEVKSGTRISAQGCRIAFELQGPEDLSRDILKSDTCRLLVPDIQLELNYGTLGGRFTTIEGLLVQVHDELAEKAQFLRGDSASPESRRVFDALLANLQKVVSGTLPCTLILDDPLANSYIQNIYAPDPDPQLTIDFYDRSFEQNEDFGLNDIKTD